MPIDFNSLFSTGADTLTSLLSSLVAIMLVWGGMDVMLLGWKMFKRCTGLFCDDVCDLDGNVIDGATWGDHGIEYDGMVFEDEGDLSDYVHEQDWSDEEERAYRDFVANDHP